MDIKNKFSNSKIDKEKERLNNKLELKGKFRLLTSKIIPLNETEKFLFIQEHKDFNFKTPLIDKNKYIYISDIYLLNFISKINCMELFSGIVKLCNGNPLRGYLGGEIRCKELKESIMSFSKSNNEQKWNRLCDISPADEELFKYCDNITISLFEASNDLIGINFELRMTEFFNKEVKNILNSLPNTKKVYDEYKYKNKKIYSVSYPRKEDIRNSKYEDFILEIKDRFNKLFNDYLPLENDYNNNPPISLNVYQTNYDLSKDNSSYFDSLDLINEHGMHEELNKSVFIRENGKGDSVIKTKMWYAISINREKIDRSNNLFFYVESKELKLINDGQMFTNIVLSTLTFYQLEEMINDISLERNKLYNCSYKKIKKNYTQYERLNQKIQKYRMMFNGLKYHSIHYNDDYLIKGFEFLTKKYNEHYNQYEELNKEYSFRMNINNSKSAFLFSKLSIVVAILALLLTIYFEYRKNENVCDNCKVNNKEEAINNIERGIEYET